MKRINIITVFLLIVFNLNAQVDLSVNYNNIHSGNSILIMGSKKINPTYEFGGGIRFNINRLKHSDDQSNIFMNRLYATKTYQYFGIDGFVHRYVFTDWKHVDPFIFYDLQLAYSTTRNRLFSPYGETSYGYALYVESIAYFGPFLWVEQNFGIGFKVDLFSSFFLTQRIGFGTALIFGNEDHLSKMSIDKFAWEFGGIINAGIGYRF